MEHAEDIFADHSLAGTNRSRLKALIGWDQIGDLTDAIAEKRRFRSLTLTALVNIGAGQSEIDPQHDRRLLGRRQNRGNSSSSRALATSSRCFSLW